MARTERPAPSSSRAVPPVDTISTPSSASPRANSTSPRLSETVRSARRTRTSPGGTTSTGPWSVVAISASLDDHVARRLGVDPHPSGRYEADRTRQQPVLDLVHSSLDRGDVARIRKDVERFLQDDRPGVDVLLDEVDGHAHDLHAVVDGLLDRPETGEGGQERRVHVDHAPGEVPVEVAAEYLHPTGQHHELDAALVEPRRERGVARRTIASFRGREDLRL